jgi:integrase
MSRRGKVFQRVRGRGKPWSFIVDVGPDGGPRKQLKRGAYPTQKAAQEALNDVLAAVQRGAFATPDRLTFGQYLETWLATLPGKGRKPTTVESYSRHMRVHVVSHPVARVRLQNLSPLHLDQLYAELLDHGRADGTGGLSMRTVRFVHSVISKALNDAVRKRLVVVNVATAASAPSTKASRPPEAQVWTLDQLHRFLDHVADDPYRAMWRLAAMTGMRRGELCGIRWKDIDFEEGRLSVRQSIVPVHGRPTLSDVKTERSERTVDLDAVTLAELRAHRARQAVDRLASGPSYNDGDLVFAKPDGTCLHPKRVSEWFGRRSAAAGLPRIRLHDIRHTHASHLLAKGVPAKVVSERLGHTTEAFTISRYQHVLPGMQSHAAQSFADLVDGQQ